MSSEKEKDNKAKKGNNLGIAALFSFIDISNNKAFC